MRVLLLVHGYPPRENAGTEQYCAAVAEGLRARGLAVQVVAATRAPGRRQYSQLREPGLLRVVNNLPARPAAQAERDRAIEAAVEAELSRFRPELVHVQHLQFLSAGLRLPVPYVLHLHDQWLWCAAGGLGLLPGGEVCPGPHPDRCAPCGAAWAPVPGVGARALTGMAGLLSPLVAPERLHGLYQRLPAGLRLRVHRGELVAPDPVAAAARNRALLDFGRGARLRISPSLHLARLAEAQGLGPVEHLPHASPAGLPRSGGGPFLFLGTIARHKGPDLVVEAWRRAFPTGSPGLALHGPMVESELLGGLPAGGSLDRAGVARALSRARALVLGSRWAENAPLVVLEARAAGCPVVAPAIGGLPELIEAGRDGLLYPPGDVEALARCLRAVEAGAVQGPSRPPPSPEHHLDQLLELYGRALGGRTQAG